MCIAWWIAPSAMHHSIMKGIFMDKDIFRTVRDLLDSRDDVILGNAVGVEGGLYSDSAENLHALQMLEPSLIELVRICVDSGLKCTALDEVIELIGFEG